MEDAEKVSKLIQTLGLLQKALSLVDLSEDLDECKSMVNEVQETIALVLDKVTES